MNSVSSFAYTQTRIQSRYSQRANAEVWIRLHNIHDLASYLHVARQTPLRPWVLGISPTHSSHEIELLLRQKYRQHVDEVTGWMPDVWQLPLQWIKRLLDLPALQYLLTDGRAIDWMKLDPDIAAFTVNDRVHRLQLMSAAGCSSLVDAVQRGDTLISGWLSQWQAVLPRNPVFNKGLQNLENLLQQYLRLQAGILQEQPLQAAVNQAQVKQNVDAMVSEYDSRADELRLIFRRYAFQPAAVCAYLAMIAIDVHHVRGALIQRLLFPVNHDLTEELPL